MLIRKLVFTAAAAMAAFSAHAADMPVKAHAVTAADWSGWYVGGNIGYGWGAGTDSGANLFDPLGGVFGVGGIPAFNAAGLNIFPSVTPAGIVGGAQIGYNWQYATPFVYEIVADIQLSDMKDGASVVAPPRGGFVTSTQGHSAAIDWFGTVRGRVGYSFGNWQPYATGGLAYGRTSNSLDFFIPATPFTMTGATHNISWGWALGAGVDFRVAASWTLGVEYLYIDLGDQTVSATPVGVLVFPASSAGIISRTDDFNAHIVRATLNYRF